MLTLVDPPEDEPQTLEDALGQDRRMRSVLVSMQLLMYGNSMKWESSFSSGKPSGGERPPGESRPLHEEWSAKYVLAPAAGREQVIADATDALIGARRGPVDIPDGESAEAWEARMIEQGRGADAAHVALTFSCLPRMVRKIRVRWKCEPEYGRPVDDLTAAELARDGLTARQIVTILKCSPGTASYHVNRAKRAA